MKFDRKKEQNLLNPDQVVINYRQQENEQGFTLEASHEGVRIKGSSTLLATPQDFESFAKSLSQASYDFLGLRGMAKKKLQQ